jgi:hypothetical protein
MKILIRKTSSLSLVRGEGREGKRINNISGRENNINKHEEGEMIQTIFPLSSRCEHEREE